MLRLSVLGLAWWFGNTLDETYESTACVEDQDALVSPTSLSFEVVSDHRVHRALLFPFPTHLTRGPECES